MFYDRYLSLVVVRPRLAYIYSCADNSCTQNVIVIAFFSGYAVHIFVVAFLPFIPYAHCPLRVGAIKVTEKNERKNP